MADTDAKPPCCDRIGAGLAVLSGILLACLFAPVYAWPLGWTAMLPLMYAVLRSRGPREAARLAFITGLTAYPLVLCWMVNVVNAAVLIFWPLFAAWLALHAALSRALWARLENKGAAGAMLWTLAAGTFWAGIEYFRAEVIWYISCPWGVLGYSQAPAQQLYQTLSLWGVYGLSALMVSVSAGMALAAPKRKAPAIAMLSVLLAASFWGSRRLHTFSAETGKQIKVALVQAEDAPLAEHIRLSVSPEALDADLLVWPELAFRLPYGGDAGAYTDLIAKGLRNSKAVAALGAGVRNFKDLSDYRRENFMLFLDGGRVVGRYDKMHPVPFVELGLKGRRKAAVIKTRLGVLGPQICYDLAFENGSRQAAERGAEILVVPTLDPAEWGGLQHTQHSDMSSARAVETGLWLVRATSSGRSQIIDPLGRERALLPNWKTGTLTGSAYMAPGGTFYTRAGWLFAPLALLLTVLALPLLRRGRGGNL